MFRFAFLATFKARDVLPEAVGPIRAAVLTIC